MNRRSRQPPVPSSASSSSFTWILLLIFVVSMSISTSDAELILNVTWCLDSSERLLNLSCGSASMIRLFTVTHGRTNVSIESNATTCSPPERDGCREKYPNAVLLLDTCSGLESCVFSSLEFSAPLKSCRALKSNYITIEYTCEVIGRNQTTSGDICGLSRLSPPMGETSTGHITSPNYPHRYDPNTRCSCQLTTAADAGDQATQVVMETIDLAMDLYPNERNPFDWLRYGRAGRSWGDGRLVERTRMDAAAAAAGTTGWLIYTGMNSVSINFNTDGQREARGFWIKYYGLNISSAETVPVEVTCRVYTPPETRQAVSCFDPPRGGELYLTCSSYGVINILRMTIGHRQPLTSPVTGADQSAEQSGDGCSPEEVLTQAVCTDDVDIPAIGNQCMRRTRCNPPVSGSSNITKCDHPNDFVLVEYQCIPDMSESGMMTDICGYDMDPGIPFVLDSGIGYFTSPLYPSNYPPNCNCYCRLEVMLHGAQVVFYVLDLRLPQTTVIKDGTSNSSSKTDGDWVEYERMDQSFGNGTKFSSKMSSGEPVYTGSNVIYLNFHSDASVEDRGFWIKYVGRSVDGLNAPVVVRCGHLSPLIDPLLPDGNGETVSTTTPTDHNGDGHNEEIINNTGLIFGLTMLAVCVSIAALAIFLFLLYRSRKRKTGMVSESKSDDSLSVGGDGKGVDWSREEDDGRWSWNSEFGRPGHPGKWRVSGSPPFTVFYNEAYRMRDPTLYRRDSNSDSSSRRKRNSLTDETLHF